MELKEILEKGIVNGRFFSLEARTIDKKGVEKHTKLTARYGVDFGSLKENQGREIGSNWFEHTENKGIVRHKKDAEKLYLQIMNISKYEVKYYKDGKEIQVDKEELKPLTRVYSLENIINIK